MPQPRKENVQNERSFNNIVVFFCLISSAQQKGQNEIVNDFVKAVFIDHASKKEIIERFLVIPSADVVPVKKSLEFLNASIDSLRAGHSALMSSGKYKLIDYNKYKGEKPNFRDGTDTIKIVLVNQVPIIYIAYQEQKVLSFFYITKGKDSYFLTI